MKLTEKDIKLADEGYKALRGKKLPQPGGRIGKFSPVSTSPGSAGKKATFDKARLILKTGKASEIQLPPQAVEILTKVLEQLAKGKEVTVASKPVEMTTQQAADFLRVSRPFLVRLLDKSEIPSRKVGSHRRVLFSDLQNYKEQIDAQRLNTLEELAAQAQELNMGY